MLPSLLASNHPLLCDALDSTSANSLTCTATQATHSKQKRARLPSVLSKPDPITPTRSNRWSHLTFATQSTADDEPLKTPSTPRSFFSPLTQPIDTTNSGSILDDPPSFFSSKIDRITRPMQTFHPWHHLADHETADDPTAGEDNNPEPWRQQYVGLVLQLMHHAEQLESFSLQLSHAQRQLHHYHAMSNTLHRQYDQQERHYEELLRSSPESSPSSISSTSSPPTPLPRRHSPLQGGDLYGSAGDDSLLPCASLATTPHPRFTNELAHKARWWTGMVLGTDVGTGQIITPFLDPSERQMVVAGFGIVADLSEELFHHPYLFRLKGLDWQLHFMLLPKDRWVADDHVVQCQCHALQPCPTLFTLTKRRHHCRSGNRLPLFQAGDTLTKWYRVCDQCFIQLISLFSR
ncbi:hypothetical protein DM01DRAFT_324436 [Hesseltinella vesiculosa]|uniref:FYVE zinc finger domain-containing protein n=1 Tax=Hesseltinella vesiculosa TaxID=101127 RepID=A0A1X2G8X9_9FUNG|nr:hypothetical protein DM01DRAFT_324436 [Hesseltinella vesiculosa]